jgi:5,6-dimethylbenzimidazole synthase
MGWVSLFDPRALAQALSMPEGSLPVAVLCIGHVEAFYPAPMLEVTGWARKRPLEELLFINRWNHTQPADETND